MKMMASLEKEVKPDAVCGGNNGTIIYSWSRSALANSYCGCELIEK